MRGGRLAHELVDVDHARIASNELVDGAEGRGARPATRLSIFEHALDGLLQVVEVQRFDEKLDRAVLHCLDDGRHVVEGGHQDDRHVRRPLAKQAQQLEPAHVRHPDVADDDVRVRLCDLGQRVRGTLGEADVKPRRGQCVMQRDADRSIIVDDQDLLCHPQRCINGARCARFRGSHRGDRSAPASAWASRNARCTRPIGRRERLRPQTLCPATVCRRRRTHSARRR